jgi:hypothetical protein
MAVFRVVMPYSLVVVANVSKVPAASSIKVMIPHLITHHPDDGSSKDL